MNQVNSLNKLIKNTEKESVKEIGESIKEYYLNSTTLENLKDELINKEIEEELIKWLAENDIELAIEIGISPIQLIGKNISKKNISKLLSHNPLYKTTEEGNNEKGNSKLKGELKEVCFDKVIAPVFENKYYSISILLQAWKKRYLLKQSFPEILTCFDMKEVYEHESLRNNKIYKDLFSCVKHHSFDESIIKQVEISLTTSYELARFRAFDGFITVIELMKQHKEMIGRFCYIFQRCFLDYHFLMFFIDNNGLSLLKDSIEFEEVRKIIYIINLLPSTCYYLDKSGINDLILEYAYQNKDKWSLNCCKEIALHGERREKLYLFGNELIQEKNKNGVDIIKNWYWREESINEINEIKFTNKKDGIKFIKDIISKDNNENDLTFIQRYHAIMNCILSDDIIPPSKNEFTLFFLDNYPINTLLHSKYYSYVNDFINFVMSIIHSEFKENIITLLSYFINTTYQSLLPKHLYQNIIDLLDNGFIPSAIIIKYYIDNKLIDESHKELVQKAILNGIKNNISVEFIQCIDVKQPLPIINTISLSEDIIKAILDHSEKYGKWELSEMYLQQSVCEFKNGNRDPLLIHLLSVARKLGMKFDMEKDILMSLEPTEQNTIDLVNYFSTLNEYDKSAKEAEDAYTSKYFEQNKFDSFDDIQIPLVAIIPIGPSSDEFFYPIAEKMEALGTEFLFDLGNTPFRFMKMSKRIFNNKNISFLRFFSIVAILNCENLKDYEIKKHINSLQSTVDANWENVYSIQFLLINYPSDLPNVNTFIKTEDNKIHVINNCPVVKNIINSVMLQLGEMKTIYPALAPDKYILPKKTTTISFLLNAGEVHLYLKHFDISFKFFKDALKMAKTSNDSFSLMTACIGMCSCLITEKKPFEDVINETLEILNKKGEKRCCKRIKLLHAQYYIDIQNNEQAKKIIEDINKIYDGNEISGDIFDCYVALQQANVLNQLGMIQHQKYILQRVSCLSKELSFANFAINELAKLLNVYFMNDIDEKEDLSSLHDQTITKVQWESLQSYVLYRSISLRNKYDLKCAQIILRLLTKYVSYIKKDDQHVLLNRLKIITKINGEVLTIPSSAEPFPFLLSTSITPSSPIIQTQSDILDSPWIVDPTADKKASEKVYLVENEESELRITFKNQLSIPVKVSCLYPEFTGVKIKTFPVSVEIPELSTVVSTIKFIPLHHGLLTIDKLNYTCCSLHFNIPVNINICVIPPLPLLKPLPFPPSITVFPGETKIISIPLLNEGNTVVGKAFVKVKGEGIYLLDCFEKQLPLQPSKLAQIKVGINTTNSLQSTIQIQYNTCERDCFARLVELPINVFVSTGLKAESWEVRSGENEIQISCILHNPSYNAFIVIMETFHMNHKHKKTTTIFSEAQSRHKLVTYIDKPDEFNKTIIKDIINREVIIKWQEAGGRNGLILFDERLLLKL
ncbi:hypothetical protein ENUP19_0341G0024 [Entamoeba nuttalli]